MKVALLLLYFVSVLSVEFSIESFATKWIRTNRASPSETMTIKVALKQQNLEYFEDLYWKVATPGTPEYGQFKTIQEIMSILQPAQEVRDRVVNWLRKSLPEVECFGDFIVASGSVLDMENQFALEIHSYTNIKGDTISRARELPIVPEDIRQDIELITGLFDLPPIVNRRHRATLQEKKAPNDDFYVVPQTLRNLYHITAQDIATNKGTTQCVVEFGKKSGVSFTDLQTFAHETAIRFYNITDIVGKFIFKPKNPIDGESTLDIQYIMATGQGAQNHYWTVDGWIFDFAVLVQTRLAQSLNVPLVFSLSYGWIENDQCEVIDDGVSCKQLGGDYTTYIRRSNTEMQKVGLTGRSILVASGDAGAASKMNLDCKNKTNPVSPAYPASSNAVLSVGGTMLEPSTRLVQVPPICANITCAGGGIEVVCSVTRALITSGGGFSDVAPSPAYQTAAVQGWINSQALRPKPAHFNIKGRAYPDVAGLAHNYLILENGEWAPVDGTSASCPVFAGIISLLNDVRLNNGHPPLGPLGPLFYKMWAAQKNTFKDVTIGNNTGTEAGDVSAGCFTEGYGATVGWDPVTGLGVPNYPAMKAYVTAMSAAHFGKRNDNFE